MKNKKIAVFALLLNLIFILSVLCLAAYVLMLKNNDTVISETETTAPKYIFVDLGADRQTETQANISGVWVFKEYEGKIGIFEENGTLIEILDVYVKTLPQTDRLMLEAGIIVKSEKEMRRLIEDYTS